MMSSTPLHGPAAWLMRIGELDAREVRVDLLWLGALSLLLIGTGIGLRDPWPADEPRFALIARDMVAQHHWLIPRVGGDIYGDKPPFFFWMIASFLMLTDSLRIAFLLPSALAGIGCVFLVYDLARRLWSREAGLIAGLALLGSIQFVWQARQAQIDATLCFFTTLSLYGLLRHCLLGSNWKWYTIGWAAAGFGIITKGVGFLPLLVLLPYVLARKGWHPQPQFTGGFRWALGPVALIAAVSIWIVPMLLAVNADPTLAHYRDEVLFKQTVSRYTDAWHHREPIWYYLTEVIPLLWLPFTALLPWLVPRWRRSWNERDLRVWLPLAWVILVVLFFSLSTGKRGVYVLPALPALALASAPALLEIAKRRGAQRVVFGIACAIAVVALSAAVYLLANDHELQKIASSYEIDSVAPLFGIGAAAALICIWARPTRGFFAYGATITATLLIVSFWVNPLMNNARSSAGFIHKVEVMTRKVHELGFVAYKEQYLLYITRPVWNFGHARWREAAQEAADAAVWLAADPQRVLLVDERIRDMCFKAARYQQVGKANRQKWFLVTGKPDGQCVRKGNEAAALVYTPVNVK